MRKLDNLELVKVTRFLRGKARDLDAPIWKALAERLEKSKHKRCVVNLSHINRHTEDSETVTVPGKVLGAGTLDHKVSIAAFCFSEEARRRIEAAGGACLTFSALVEKNPKGENLKIIG